MLDVQGVVVDVRVAGEEDGESAVPDKLRGVAGHGLPDEEGVEVDDDKAACGGHGWPNVEE